MRRSWYLVFFALLSFASVAAQQCPQAPVLSSSHELNLFSEQQEIDFGDILAERISYSLHVIEDDSVAGYLQRIGDRLLPQMPPTKLRFRFYLVDSPDANAFAVAGGRVYVNRKLITTIRSEDELAGVLAHELGHQLAHHSALDWSRIFHDMLGITKLGDRADIQDKYNQVLDAYRTKEGVFTQSNRGEREQLGADQVAVYAVARAGYAPQALVDFWDRVTESRGRKGSWISDFLGTTRPESKRLREFVKNLGALPPACVNAATHASSADFQLWQTAVRQYKGFGKKEDLHNVVLKRRLNPALREDIRFFRFSPDGKYLLAQDNTSIFVLTRDPLQYLFRIDAVDAHNAEFSPDSRFLVFSTSGLRVERWNIADQRLDDVHELYVFNGCVQTALSPEGNYLACLRPNRDRYFQLDFLLLNVNSGEAVFTRNKFVDAGEFVLVSSYLVLQRRARVATMAFAPDGRYLVVGAGSEGHLVFDMKSLSEVPVSGTMRTFTFRNFAFVGPDRIIGAEGLDSERASLLRFPSGEVIASGIPINNRTLYPASKGLYALVRPMQKAPVGLIDLQQKKIFMASRTDALDIYDGQFVNERINGEIGLYTQAGQKPVATLALPPSPLARLAAAVIAPGMNAIALSERSRGAVWDLGTGERVFYVRGFHGAWFDTGSIYFDFAPIDQVGLQRLKGQSEKDLRRLEAEQPGDALARADLSTGSIVPIRETQKRVHVLLVASIVLTWSPENEDDPLKNITVEAHDARTGAGLWSRRYSKSFPRVHGSLDSETVVFSWHLGTQGAKEELKDDPEAKKLVDSVKESEGSYLVEIVDLRTGKPVRKFPIETGRASFSARAFKAGGSTLLMLDDHRRALLYSFKGARLGAFFGGEAAISPDGSLVVVEREPGRLALYDVASLHPRDQLTFGSRVAFAHFTADSQRLVVLTDDQTVFVFNVPPAASSAAARLRPNAAGGVKRLKFDAAELALLD